MGRQQRRASGAAHRAHNNEVLCAKDSNSCASHPLWAKLRGGLEEAHVRHRELEDKGVQDLTYLERTLLVGHAPFLLPSSCCHAHAPRQEESTRY